MFNKRGAWGTPLLKIVIIVGLVMGGAAVYEAFGGQFSDYGLIKFEDAFNSDNLKGYEEIFGEGGPLGGVYRSMNYIFGKVPVFLGDNSSGFQGGDISAAIIMIGIWVLFFLIFADISKLFSTFSEWISWVIGFVLAVIVANFKITSYMAIIGFTFAAGFGAFSVIVGVIMIFVVFLAFNFGSEAVHNWVVHRKQAEFKLRAAMGSSKARAGLDVLSDIGEDAAKRGR